MSVHNLVFKDVTEVWEGSHDKEISYTVTEVHCSCGFHAVVEHGFTSGWEAILRKKNTGAQSGHSLKKLQHSILRGENMRLSAYDRYSSDPIFVRIVDTLYMMLETQSEYSGLVFTPTEMREAAMLACEKFEYRHIRPMLILENSTLSKAMFGSNKPKTVTEAAAIETERDVKAHR